MESEEKRIEKTKKLALGKQFINEIFKEHSEDIVCYPVGSIRRKLGETKHGSWELKSKLHLKRRHIQNFNRLLSYGGHFTTNSRAISFKNDGIICLDKRLITEAYGHSDIERFICAHSFITGPHFIDGSTDSNIKIGFKVSPQFRARCKRFVDTELKKREDIKRAILFGE